MRALGGCLAEEEQGESGGRLGVHQVEEKEGGGLAAGLRRRGDGDQDPGAAGATAGRVAWREQGRLKGADTEHGMAR
jgi:hypothetical protein